MLEKCKNVGKTLKCFNRPRDSVTDLRKNRPLANSLETHTYFTYGKKYLFDAVDSLIRHQHCDIDQRVYYTVRHVSYYFSSFFLRKKVYQIEYSV